ncbi:MAG: asparagine synthase C-terminal domain-containing protein, partial [Klebsiella quasipneumoniae]|nr:asparagine synthase C-terminal domain-containing protein [Klebsiella quasipneumoniae]
PAPPVRFLVPDAVRRLLVSDVRGVSFLSGGIDSSIVTALASNLLQASGGQMNTFSFDFQNNDLYYQQNDFQPERDRPFVEQMVAQYPVNHTFLECDEEHLFDYLMPSVDARDMPGMADVDASLLYFCGLVKEQNKVTLTGECADEIFGGYPWFFRQELLNANAFPWSRDTAPRTALLSDGVQQSLRLEEYAADRYADSLRAVPRLPGESLPDARRREITHLNIRWFMQTLLDRMDRTSMAAGLEARVPFADHRIVEYLFNVPWNMKSRNGIAKSLLRDAFAGLLPPSLMTRKKSPYPKTYHPGYEALLRNALMEVMQDPSSPLLTLVDKKRAIEYIQTPAQYTQPWFGQLMAGPQMLAYLLQINYWLGKYHLC